MSPHDQDELRMPNPLEPSDSLMPEPVKGTIQSLHPQKDVAEEDSAVTKAEKFERHAAADAFPESAAKRVKLDVEVSPEREDQSAAKTERQKGIAPIKAESVFIRK